MTSEGSWTDSADSFASDERVRLAAESRRRERWVRQRSLESATLAAALHNARGRPVALHLCTGSTVLGTIRSTGIDVVALDTATGPQWVVTDAVTAVELDEVPLADEQGGAVTLAEVLEERRVEGHPVSITLAGGVTVHGELLSVGGAVVLRDPADGTHVVADLSAIVSVS